MTGTKLSRAEMLIVGFGVVLLVDSFFPWFRACIKFLGRSTCVGSENAWGTGLSLLGVLVALLMIVQVVLTKIANVELPRLGTLTWGQVHMYAGIASFVLILLQALVGDHGISRTFWLWLGVLLAAGLAYAGWQRSQEPETTSAVGPAGPTGPPPPPPV